MIKLGSKEVSLKLGSIDISPKLGAIDLGGAPLYEAELTIGSGLILGVAGVGYSKSEVGASSNDGFFDYEGTVAEFIKLYTYDASPQQGFLDILNGTLVTGLTLIAELNGVQYTFENSIFSQEFRILNAQALTDQLTALIGQTVPFKILSITP